jgi:hypothetical protein
MHTDPLEEAEKLIAECENKLSAIANRVLQEAADWLETSGDLRGPLIVRFGNGSEYVEYCRYQLYFESAMNGRPASLQWNGISPDWAYLDDGSRCDVIEHLDEFAEALDIAITVVDGYRKGCPEDITISC